MTTVNQQFSSALLNQAIPDPGTTTSLLNVTGMNGTMSDVNITLNITHTWDTDLDVYLTAPNGQQIPLFTDVGDAHDNFTNTILDNEASVKITDGSAPFTGRYIPEGYLPSLNGINPNGNWILTVSDDDSSVFFDSYGTLNSWSLDITTTVLSDDEIIYGDIGGSKADVLMGNAGDDVLYGLNMADTLSGGIGNDKLWGGYGKDVLSGNEGDDKLNGEQDSDSLDGGTGNDTLDGGEGVDTLVGGAGNDTYFLGYDATDIITDNGLSTDVDTVIMPYQLTSYTLPVGIENGTLTKSAQASQLTGNISNNMLTGNAGKNVLNGAAGRDKLFGGTGDDVLFGGKGHDALTGGAGKDIFKFLDNSMDKIIDFKPIDDTIQLENTFFTQLGSKGTLNANLFNTGTAAADSNDHLIYNPNDGKLYYDVDGSGSDLPIQIALLGVNLTLTNADFTVI